MTEINEKKQAHHIQFAARYVPMLAQFAGQPSGPWDWSSEIDYQGLQIEPCEEGGVWLCAISRFVMARIHDKGGKATKAIAISLPDAFVDACREPKPRTFITCNCEPFEVVPPDWMRPGNVDLMIGPDPDFYVALVGAKATPPDVDEEDAGLYTGGSIHDGGVKVLDRKIVTNWRKLGDRPDAPVDRVWVQSRVFQWLAPYVSDLELSFGGDNGMIRVTSKAMPELTVFVMPLKPREPDTEPVEVATTL